MARKQSRRERHARVHIARRLLCIAMTAAASTTVWAQTETQPAAGTPAAPAAAPEAAAETEAPALALPVGRPFGFTHNESVDLSQTYETMPLGIINHPDTFTTLALGIGLHDHTLRFTGDLQYTLFGYAYARDGRYDQLTNYLTALATGVIVPEHVLLHVSAFATPILVNQFGPVAAPGVPVARGVNTGLQDAYGYSVSPELAFRLGNFASSDAVLTDSAVYFVNPYGTAVNEVAPVGLPPRQYTSYTATERLASGTDFARLNWQVSGTGAWFYESGIDFRQLSGIANLAYALTHEFSLLATGGYQAFRTNQTFTSNLDGVIAYGGVQFSMIPRLHASFEAGEQFNRPSYISDVFYQITPFTTFTFTLTDSITTPAAGLLGSLGQIGVNNLGNFYNTGYQLAPNTPPATISPVQGFTPVPLNGAAITDVIYRSRVAFGSLVHMADRMQYRLTGYWDDYQAVVQTANLGQQQIWGGEFAVSRNINPYLTGIVAVDYNSQRVLGGDLDTVSGYVMANYQLSQLMSVYFRIAYIDRLANAALTAASPITNNLTDTAITIGIHRTF